MRLKLKIFRITNDLTQAEMAKKMGCSRVAYGFIEKGIRDGSLCYWQKLQKAFEITDSELIELMQKQESEGE